MWEYWNTFAANAEPFLFLGLRTHTNNGNMIDLDTVSQIVWVVLIQYCQEELYFFGGSARREASSVLR